MPSAILVQLSQLLKWLLKYFSLTAFSISFVKVQAVIPKITFCVGL